MRISGNVAHRTTLRALVTQEIDTVVVARRPPGRICAIAFIR
jgi:hypothetical protein